MVGDVRAIMGCMRFWALALGLQGVELTVRSVLAFRELGV